MNSLLGNGVDESGSIAASGVESTSLVTGFCDAGLLVSEALLQPASDAINNRQFANFIFCLPF